MSIETTDKIKAIISAVLKPSSTVMIYLTSDGAAIVESHSGIDLAYDKLKELSDRLGTTDINISYDSGCSGSECTPGDPSVFTLFIHNITRAVSMERPQWDK